MLFASKTTVRLLLPFRREQRGAVNGENPLKILRKDDRLDIFPKFDSGSPSTFPRLRM